MLSQILAVVVGLGSVALYLAAFFFPEVHRRHDFFWSGVGLFYALVLWFCAGQVTATEWLGHGASVSLLGWLGWQTLTLRRKRTPVTLQTPYTEDSWPNFWRELQTLTQDVLRQTPLRRWLPSTAAVSQPNQQAGLRASSLKDVGYEFLDDVEPAEESAPKLSSSAELLRPVQLANRAEKLARGNLSTRPATQPRPQPGSTNRPTKPSSPPKPVTWWQRGQVMVTWTGDLFRSMTAPKAKKPVIEIPPREPSLQPKSPAGVNLPHPSQTTNSANPPPAVPDDWLDPPPQAINIVNAQVSVEADANPSSDEQSQPVAQIDPPITAHDEEKSVAQTQDAEPEEPSL